MKKEIYIIGSGPGDINYLTREARETIINCEEIYAFDRFYNLFQGLRHDIAKCSYNEIINKAGNSSAKTIGILVSGDVGFFSITKTLIETLGNFHKIYTLCGISSLQYFCARVGIGYENIRIVSLHGREQSILGNIAYNRYTFVLTGGENNAVKILKKLLKNGAFDINVTTGENLSMTDEKIVTGSVSELMKYDFGNLTVLLFENKNYKNKEEALFDKDFVRNKTPMTKQEVRWVCLNTLNVKPKDIVFDIGAGSGSVAIEMARKAYNGIVYAVEKNSEAYNLLNENKIALGALNLLPVQGEAAFEIKKLPVPDKVFIGGSGGNLREIVLYLYNKNPKIAIVINAIALETLGIAVNVFKELGINPSVCCLNCARNNIMGEYNLMTANNPVYIISVGQK